VCHKTVLTFFQQKSMELEVVIITPSLTLTTAATTHPVADPGGGQGAMPPPIPLAAKTVFFAYTIGS